MYAVRTCVGCRSKAARTQLLRFVAVAQSVVPDERGGMPGRGGWVHIDLECFERALAQRAFARALRVSGKLDTSPLENRLKTTMDK